ncbi:MAG: hypothetical protein NT081_04240 [Actinobacteria bacterium]|nr:hypothetical protein [Actinomycetota bacterium]
MKRAAAISLAALLSVGGATTALVSIAGADANDPSVTTTTEASAPAVTDFSSTLAGLGDISLTFDPITHEISNIVVTPLDGITAAVPIAVNNSIQLVFTLADGTVMSIVVEVEGDHGSVTLEFDNQSPEDAAEKGGGHRSDGPPPIEDRGVSADHRNDNHDRHGPDVATPPTTTPTTTVTPPVTGAPAQLRSSNRQGSESQSGRNSRSGGRD